MRLILLVATAGVAFGCTVVDGPNITGKDMAAANPSFATLDPASIVASSPIPGVRRVMHPAELARIEQTPGPFEEICFERATKILNANEILAALESALRSAISREAQPKIEILDFIRTPVPLGTLEFSPTGLSAAGIWRGHIKCDDNRTAPLWAKVRVTTEQTWIEAIQPLAPGKPIAADQLTMRSGPRFPFGQAPIGAVELISTRVPNRTIRPGEPIFPSMLAAPHDVERGETIRVLVSSGEAQISFDAVAESSGRAGETVLVKNPENGRHFQARVQEKGKVSIIK
ncbi:MAG: flagellar basal body P-ring formation chaperone FlgA [Acidobacteriia bacterium]|nr:flagellar basal body P-ring formation chaperone FlgA [Terriglobia bacterium]